MSGGADEWQVADDCLTEDAIGGASVSHSGLMDAAGPQRPPDAAWPQRRLLDDDSDAPGHCLVSPGERVAGELK